jgi:RimJ/RimL family protein N-acetyltransferase
MCQVGTAEIGHWVDSCDRNRGVATTSVQAARRRIFTTLATETIARRCEVGNTALLATHRKGRREVPPGTAASPAGLVPK